MSYVGYGGREREAMYVYGGVPVRRGLRVLSIFAIACAGLDEMFGMTDPRKLVLVWMKCSEIF